ncbi:DUF2242 domain-containing protein [Variovorax sp. PvP013]|uniref:DUF2242 domain-containing protein n=1 Tax=Variovorax sp. PvP013 TaxID=3156435 RepID=UPI003D23448B
MAFLLPLRPSLVPSRAIRSPMPRRGAAVAIAAALVLAGCGATAKRVNYDPEEFDSTTTHARSYPATEAQTCEAARRALLSQGYLISAANADLVTGRKSFQPTPEVHVEVEFRVVCAHEGASDGTAKSASGARGKGVAPRSIAFVTALQDRYGIKKTNNSATLGVGVLGSVSLPFSSSDDAMVKLASETLTDERFYDRFFALLDRFLVRGAGVGTDAVEAVEPQREAPVVAPASGLAVTAPVAAPVEPVTRPLETSAASPSAPSSSEGAGPIATPAVPAAPVAPTGPVAP